MERLQGQQRTSGHTTPSPIALDFDDLLAAHQSTTAKEETASPHTLRTFGRHDYQRISTFHSSFLKILKRDLTALDLGYSSTFSILDAQDSTSLIKQLLKQHRLDDRVEYQEAKGMISMRKNN